MLQKYQIDLDKVNKDYLLATTLNQKENYTHNARKPFPMQDCTIVIMK